MDRFTGLTAFVRVVDSGGFSAASRRLKMSTTMVSKHVQDLEERLGARLINRTTRKISLTEVGKAYYERCTQILDELEEADEAARALQSTPRGVLRLYIASQIVPFIAPVVAEYLALYPQAKVDLVAGIREFDMIDEGIDLAIRPSLPADTSLIVRNLASWRHVVCAAPAYLAEKGRPKHLADLQTHNCMRHMLYPYQNEWHFTDGDGVPAIARVSGNLVSNSGDTLHTAALLGRGIFLGPGFMVAEDVRTGRLVRLFEELRSIEMTINAIYPHRHYVPAKVRSFIDLLVSHSAEHRRLFNPYA